MEFKKELLQKLTLYHNETLDGVRVVENKITNHFRWSVEYTMILEKTGKFYKTTYSVGATENQEEEPYEYEDEYVDCKEVKPIEKVITVYE